MFLPLHNAGLNIICDIFGSSECGSLECHFQLAVDLWLGEKICSFCVSERKVISCPYLVMMMSYLFR